MEKIKKIIIIIIIIIIVIIIIIIIIIITAHFALIILMVEFRHFIPLIRILSVIIPAMFIDVFCTLKYQLIH